MKYFHQKPSCPETFPFLVLLTPNSLTTAMHSLSIINSSNNLGKFWLGWWIDPNHGSERIWKSDFDASLDEKDFEKFKFPKIDEENAPKQCLIGYIKDGKLEFTTKSCRRRSRWICTKISF